MTRSELIARLALHHPKLTPQDVEMAVFEIFSALQDSLARGNRVEIRGFGAFTVSYRPTRSGRNPKTGETVTVPAKQVPHFKAGKELRERVQQSATPQAAPWTV
jgi:integration host factor subunit beta